MNGHFTGKAANFSLETQFQRSRRLNQWKLEPVPEGKFSAKQIPFKITALPYNTVCNTELFY